MSELTRDAILAVRDIQIERVHVPEWGGDVYVRGLTGAERDEFEANVIVRRGRDVTLNLRNMRARLVALTLCDAQGNRLFGEADIAALSQKSAAALQRVFEVAQRLSGLSDRDVEELAKNSESDPSADSGFDSR